MKSFFAYLDAGTGSLIVQSVIGAAVAVGVFLKTFWGRITSVFRRGNKSTATTASSKTVSKKASE